MVVSYDTIRGQKPRASVRVAQRSAAPYRCEWLPDSPGGAPHPPQICCHRQNTLGPAGPTAYLYLNGSPSLNPFCSRLSATKTFFHRIPRSAFQLSSLKHVWKRQSSARRTGIFSFSFLIFLQADLASEPPGLVTFETSGKLNRKLSVSEPELVKAYV